MKSDAVKDTEGPLAVLQIFLKGMAMGTADAVPGVSGGTIAVITHIYERLVYAIRAINPRTLQVWRKEGGQAFWRAIDGNFLLILALGILAALVLVANTVLYLLAEHYQLLMAFFIGLVLASTVFLWRLIEQWSALTLLSLVGGAALTSLISLANPAAAGDSLLYLFLCGVIAICAMILPGISGAFILILLGVYERVLDALRSLQIDIILVFAAGCAVGLLGFAHLLAWLFQRFRDRTYAFLTGMLAASVTVLWPWKDIISTRIASDGREQVVQSVNVMPGRYEALTGQDPQVAGVLFCLLLGALIIVAFEKTIRKADG